MSGKSEELLSNRAIDRSAPHLSYANGDRITLCILHSRRVRANDNCRIGSHRIPCHPPFAICISSYSIVAIPSSDNCYSLAFRPRPYHSLRNEAFAT